MSLIRPTPAFVPPVVAIPAANNIVPFLPGIIGATAGTTATVAGVPALAVIGASVAGAVLGGVLAAALWNWANGGRGAGATTSERPAGLPATARGGRRWTPPPGGAVRVYDSKGFGLGISYGVEITTWFEPIYESPPDSKVYWGWFWISTPSGSSRWREEVGLKTWNEDEDLPFGITITQIDSNGESAPLSPTLPHPDEGSPYPPPPLLPEPEREPQPLPTRPAVVPPLTVPTFPSERPSSPVPAAPPSPGTPNRTAPPAPAPVTPVLPFPGWPVQPPPDATQTQPDGTLAPTPKAPPTTTPTDTHVVDGIPIPGNGPRPTPEGTAKELGRIENKLARLLDPKSDGPGQPKDRLSWLRDNITNIVDFFLSIQAGGTYELSSPCEVDENGDRVVRSVEYAGALQSFGVLNNKLDALAALLQEHKDLKQPICRQTPAVGEPVTVNFVQVD